MKKIISALDKVGIFSGWMNMVGVAVIFITVVATCCDVFMRYVFKSPIHGVYEYTAAGLVLIVYLGLAYTLKEKGHITVDLFTQKLHEKGRLISDFANDVVGLTVSVIMVWRAVEETRYFIENNATTTVSFHLSAIPFGFVMIFGSALFALVFLRNVLADIENGKTKHLNAGQWITAVLLPCVIIAVSVFLMYSDFKWSTTAIGVAGIVVSLLLMFMGMPISIAFIVASLVFISLLKKPSMAYQLMSNIMFSETSSYSWTVIPFFLLMGYLCFEFGFGEDLYDMAYRWLGRLPGGLAIATVTACALFAAIVGNGTAPCVTMGAVALPAMQKYKYREELSTGTIIGGCSLGPIIPPSQPLIIYAMLTSQSVGQLFIASLVPGIVLWLLFSLYIFTVCKIKPDMGPKGQEKFSLREKGKYTLRGLPIIIIFVVVIGGIYAGVFSATEAGAIGCGLILIIAIIMRRISFKKIKNALLDTGKGSAMIFLILIGATMLGKIITLAKLPQLLSNVITSLSMSPHLAVIIILLIFFILGFFIDMMPLILIGVPVVHPAIVALGFNPIWFTILLSIVIGVGTITPPVGINLFTLKGVAKSVPIKTIFKGALPFAFVTMALIVILYVAPGLVTWLPGLLY